MGSSGIVVLMYHGIGTPASEGEVRYTVTEEAFAAQVDLLGGRAALSYPELLEGRSRPGSVVLTFDDGEQSVLTHALPFLRSRGITATIFVTTGWIGREGYLDADGLRRLSGEGWTIGSHGVTHRFLSDLSAIELQEEVVRSRETLARILGDPPDHLSLPGGRINPGVVEAVRRAGYRSLATSEIGVNPPVVDRFAVRRMMVLRPWDLPVFYRIVDGDARIYLQLQARQGLLDWTKRALGNTRYQALRARALKIVETLRR
jgi:peptidoglycan/xylan/chitin deacetylase (PgdA/CDA1 family)